MLPEPVSLSSFQH